MKEEGYMLTCDRCGMSKFFRKTGNRLVDTADGYKTRTEYESNEKWGEEHLINNKHYRFCPACNGQYMRMVIDFAKPLNSFTERD